MRFDISGSSEHLLPLGFSNSADNSRTIVLINDDVSGKAFTINGDGLTGNFHSFITDSTNNCLDIGKVDIGKVLYIPGRSVLTLYSKN